MKRTSSEADASDTRDTRQAEKDGSVPSLKRTKGDTRGESTTESDSQTDAAVAASAVPETEGEETTQPYDEESDAQRSAAPARSQAGATDSELVLRFGSESLIGPKPTNEDRVIEDEYLGELGHLYAVLDGHGGEACVSYVTRCLAKNVMGAVFARSKGQVLRFRGEEDIAAGEDQGQEASASSTSEAPSERYIQSIAHMHAELSQYRQQEAELQQLIDAGEKSLEDMLTSLREVITLMESKLAEQTRLTGKFQAAILRGMRDAFSRTDRNYLGLAKKRGDEWKRAGTTANLVCVFGTSPWDAHAICANVGDTRAVLCRGGKAIRLSEDHKPNRPDEKARVEKAGGGVTVIGQVPRVYTNSGQNNGMKTWLAVSRAFGDSELKEPSAVVSVEPETTVTKLLSDDAFIIIGCDGVWDVMSDQDAVDLARKHYGNPNAAAKAVAKEALKRGSMDNVTAVVVEMAWNDTDELRSSLAKAQEAAAPGPAAADDVDDIFA